MAASSLMVPLGSQAPDFTLPDTTGAMTGRDDFTAAPALLVAFLCNHCPYVRHIETALASLPISLIRVPYLTGIVERADTPNGGSRSMRGPGQ